MIASTKKICTACVAAAILLAGALMVLPNGIHNGDALAGPGIGQNAETTEPNQWKTMPADPLLPDGISSWPLPGNGSN